MRTARVMVASMLLLALVVGPGAASAQPAGSDLATPAYTTVNETGIEDLDLSVGASERFPWGWRYATQGFRSTVEADDPRVSGDHTVIFNLETAAEQGVGRATALVRIVNDGGSWEGPVNITYYPERREFRFGLLEGTGDYEGLMFSMAYSGEMGVGQPFQGLIWEGDPPLVPDAELLPD